MSVMKMLAAIFLLCFACSAAVAQSLDVAYDGKTMPVDLSKMSHEQIKYTSPHNKSEHMYSCVSLAPVLAAAGVPQGEKLRGKFMTLMVVASAKDNYHAVFSLAELDAGMGPTKAYVCDADAGKPLAEAEAPLKLLVTTDKRPARSVRMLTGLEVKNAQ
jgi:hypothetical protein